MRMKQGITAEPKSHVGVNVANEEIKITKPNAKVYNITGNETEKKDDKKIEEHDKITEALQNLRLEPSTYSSDESEYEDEGEISTDMVAKGPDRDKNNKIRSSPYPQSYHSQQQKFYVYNSDTGGDVFIEDNNYSYIPNIPTEDFYIPESVVEHSEIEPDLSNLNEIDSFFKHLLPEDLKKMNSVLDEFNLCSESVNVNPNVAPSPPHQQPYKTPEITDGCGTPDSGCIVLSPASSISSPNTPQSNTPPANVSSDSEASSSNSLEHDYFNSNDIVYPYSQETSNWDISQQQTKPEFNVPVTHKTTDHDRNNISPTTPPKISQQQMNKVNNLGGNNLDFDRLDAPIQTYTVNRSGQPNHVRSIQTFNNIQPTGSPVSTVRLMVSEEPKQYCPLLSEPKQYTQLLPVNRGRNLQNIRPDSVSVSEVELDTSSVERLMKMCSRRIKEIEWTIVCLEKENEINAVNDQNQTKLMQILREKPTKQYLEKIYARVQRIKKEKRRELLRKRDNKGHNALYMAVVLQKDQPILARYIADTYVELNMSPDEVYGPEGDSILHVIAGAGDTYAQVLADLLHVNGQNGEKGFDVNRKNNMSLTPLHVAANLHKFSMSTLTVTQLLVKNGAFIMLQNDEGKTPLHLAVQGSCDPVFIKALLQSPHASSCVNIPDQDGNTPLHICTARNDLIYDKQKKVIVQLITSGASHNIHNRNGRLALSLVAPERKQEVKNLLNRKHNPNLLSS